MEKLNLPPFYVGQKVICVNSIGTYGLTKNKIYTVHDIFNCVCGIKTVDLGFKTAHAGSRCSNCRKANTGVFTYRLDRFRPLQEQKFRAVTFEKVMEETEAICEN